MLRLLLITGGIIFLASRTNQNKVSGIGSADSDLILIKNTLSLINEQTGLNLKLDPDFKKLTSFKRKKYFTVILNKPVFDSIEFDILERFAKKFNLIEVQPSGYKRVAISIIK
jgi:hypothetical protein